MEQSDTIVVKQTLDWLKAGSTVFFITVVKTTGSSPRPIGSIMSINQAGAFVGSVSSGCIEELLREKLSRDVEKINFPATFTYGDSKEEAERLQLPCGAIVELMVELISKSADFEEIQTNLKNGKTVLRALDVATGEVHVSQSERIELFDYSEAKLKKVFGPAWQILLVGAGDISFYLTQMAPALGFTINICEPRIEYTESWALDQSLLDNRMPDDIIRDQRGISRYAIIALTHDPRIDDLAILEALSSDAFYIGALGSKKNNEARKKRLRSLGVSERNIERLHGPVGLNIGSKTPAEIAVAIIAELVAVRNSSRVKHNNFQL